MALWPNNWRDNRGHFPCNIQGSPAFVMAQQRTNRNLAFFGNTNIASAASIPEGSFGSSACILPPLVGGGMASADNADAADLSATGSLISGGRMNGSAPIVMSADGMNLSLVVSMSGTATAVLSCNGMVLALTIGLQGAASWTLTASGQLGMIVPFSASGSFTLSATANLKGLLSMAGESTPFTELSPQSLASAVWAALTGDNNSAGSMGEALQAGGGGGGGLTVEQANWLREIFEMHGLDPAKPLVVSPTARTVGSIVQTIAEAGSNVTVQRS